MDQRFLLKVHASAKSIELIKEDRNLLYLYFCKVSTELLFEVNPREAFYKLILVWPLIVKSNGRLRYKIGHNWPAWLKDSDFLLSILRWYAFHYDQI